MLIGSRSNTTDTVKINDSQNYSIHPVAIVKNDKVIGTFIGASPYDATISPPDMWKRSKIFSITTKTKAIHEEMLDIFSTTNALSKRDTYTQSSTTK